MSITDYLPRIGLLDRPAPKHRAVDEVARLRHQLDGAGIFIKGLRVQVADAELKLDRALAHQAEAEELVVQLQADKDELIEERDGLAEELAVLKRRFGPQLAAEANANAITVPPMRRDTSAIEDQATQPIPVLHLPDAAAAGLLGPVLDPGHP
ncbi:hypothetical protein ACWET9_32315 [Streptomyces sp. NPDC004059]